MFCCMRGHFRGMSIIYRCRIHCMLRDAKNLMLCCGSSVHDRKKYGCERSIAALGLRGGKSKATGKQNLDRNSITSIEAGFAPTVVHDPGSPCSWHQITACRMKGSYCELKQPVCVQTIWEADSTDKQGHNAPRGLPWLTRVSGNHVGRGRIWKC